MTLPGCEDGQLFHRLHPPLCLILNSHVCVTQHFDDKMPLFTCQSNHFVPRRRCTKAPKFKKVNYHCATKKIELSPDRKALSTTSETLGVHL